MPASPEFYPPGDKKQEFAAHFNKFWTPPARPGTLPAMTVQIFGILNVTPDSFSDGDDFFDPAAAIAHAAQMIADGADILDVGGESTRPDAEPITPAAEWKRVEPVLKLLSNKFAQQKRVKISLDTRHAETAEKFFALGGMILNDVSGCADPRMRDLVAAAGVTVVVNHFPGADAVAVHAQKIDSVAQVQDELLIRREQLVAAGVAAERIILDPGIGFGKTMPCNHELLKFASLVPDIDVMIGHSRKRFLGSDRFKIQSNLEAAQIAVDAGTKFLRVHDVKPHADLLRGKKCGKIE